MRAHIGDLIFAISLQIVAWSPLTWLWITERRKKKIARADAVRARLAGDQLWYYKLPWKEYLAYKETHSDEIWK